MQSQFRFLIASLLVLLALLAACASAPTPTPVPPSPTALSPTVTPVPPTVTPAPTASNSPTGTLSSASSGPCMLVTTKALTAYTRPSTQAAVFGQVPIGDKRPVGGATADGWIGFDPGVAQAANVGPFRLRWVQKSDAAKLEGACDASHVPTVANLPPTACFEMFMEQTKIYTTANKSSAVIVTAKAGDYAQVTAANATWLQLDLNIGSLKQAKTGWVDRAAANFNGPCDKLPAAK